jgi:hypothetical protein
MRLANRFTDSTALAVTLCWVGLLALTGSTDVLLFIAPALLIAIPLFGGHYLGEELISKLATGKRSRPRRGNAAGKARRPSAVPESWRPRGTSLLAFSLAKRPPPAFAFPQN